MFQRPKDVSRGRPQDVSKGRPLALHREPYGDVLRTPSGHNFAEFSRTIFFKLKSRNEKKAKMKAALMMCFNQSILQF